MLFVSKTDFDLIPHNIPNLTGNNSFLPFCESAQEEILLSLLGKSLYTSFMEGLDTDYPDQKWLDLRDGASYEYAGKNYDWVGMNKMLVPYIFSEWLLGTFDTNSGIGVVVAKGENSKVINPGNRIARAWNKFYHYAGTRFEKKDTLYGFLLQEGTAGTFDGTFDDTFTDFVSYLNFVFKNPGRKNTFNL